MKKRKYPIPAVEVANGRVVWRPYIRFENRTADIKVDRKGRLAPPLLLGKVGDDIDAIMRTYLQAKSTLEKTHAAKTHTLRWVLNEYMRSRQYRELAVNTRKRDVSLLLILDHPLEINGNEDQLGNLHLIHISKPLFNQIKESRYKKRQQAGQKGEAQTNREISLISSALSWAVNNLTGIGIEHNPLLGLKKLKETPNLRYVTDLEYQQQISIASEDEHSILPIVFELTYLTATRGIEVLNIKVSDCTSEGIYIKRTKGSKSNLILWSPRLRDAYQSAITRHKQHKILPIDPPLLLSRDGQPLTRSGLDSAMQRLKQKMKARGLEVMYWHLHLLKSKGVSDAKNKRIAGHRSEAMRERYNTKMEVFEPAG
ncbi:Phage integrase family protein [Thiothrix eikelboomii]|uniref:Phage integrase family protein n=1 Tax=Thiothrix eikelboomii TaxID=92487 RepID=A0A1T4XFT6_9GAMM|nr:tyrosine-type recombinase/integrase [Thiothrix eikelboomii]SKA88432.1 Phage integrase family protein [Thiothrix eikelboomii]